MRTQQYSYRDLNRIVNYEKEDNSEPTPFALKDFQRSVMFRQIQSSLGTFLLKKKQTL